MKKRSKTLAMHEEVYVPNRHYHHEELEKDVNAQDSGNHEDRKNLLSGLIDIGRKTQDDDE